jgi:hypothetical protein
MCCLALVHRFETINGNVRWRTHAEPDSISADLHDNDFDVAGDDNSISDFP